jgi:hypothetical protein
MHPTSPTQRWPFALKIVALVFVISVLRHMLDPFAGPRVLTKARVTQARSAEVSLVNGLKSFRIEYGHYPELPLTDRAPAKPLRSRGPLLAALLGHEAKLNPNKVVYMIPAVAKDHKTGFEENKGEHVLYDPWGEPYYILIDWKEEDQVPDPEHPGQFVSASVLIYSSGPDRNVTTWQDNVVSWK